MSNSFFFPSFISELFQLDYLPFTSGVIGLVFLELFLLNLFDFILADLLFDFLEELGDLDELF